MHPASLAIAAVRLLSPLVGIQGRFEGRTLELIEVLEDGPRVALMEITATPGIRVNQYGNALSRQPRILTVPVVSGIDADAHPALRALLPEAVLEPLRALIRDHVQPSS